MRRAALVLSVVGMVDFLVLPLLLVGRLMAVNGGLVGSSVASMLVLLLLPFLV